VWGLWFGPHLALAFVVVIIISLLVLFSNDLGWLKKVAAAVAIPFGCAAIPIVGLMGLIAINAIFQSTDKELYEEIFGYEPTISEDRMLSNASGWRKNRKSTCVLSRPPVRGEGCCLSLTSRHLSTI
jgi:hypothetical protein